MDDVRKVYADINADRSHYKTTNDEPTPIKCVEEMLNRVPSSFWDTHPKVLDPCCGCGNFSVVLREKGVLETDMVLRDVNDDRLAIARRNFPHAAVENTNFLESVGSGQFDMVVANPPYAKLMPDGRRASKNHNLIGAFVQKALEHVRPGGFIVFITPDNWMSMADRNTTCRLLTSLQIHHLNIHTAKKYFPKVGSSFTWYVVENTPFYKPMVVEGKWGAEEIPSEARSFIPLRYTNEIRELFDRAFNSGRDVFKVETSSDLHKYTKRNLIVAERDDEHPHRLIHTPKQTVWSSRPHKFQEGWKVFLGLTSQWTVYVDNCGMTQSVAFIRCESMAEAERVAGVLRGEEYKTINDLCRWGNFNNVRILQMLPTSLS